MSSSVLFEGALAIRPVEFIPAKDCPMRGRTGGLKA